MQGPAVQEGADLAMDARDRRGACLEGEARIRRREDDVIEAHETFIDARLRRENVEARSCDDAAFERRDQRLLVDHAAARHVDENAVAAEPLEEACVDEMMRLIAACAR